MILFIKNIFVDFPEDATGICLTLAGTYLFTTRDREQTHQFHHMAVHLLFLTCDMHCDIQPTIAFITTRVNYYDKDKQRMGTEYLGV